MEEKLDKRIENLMAEVSYGLSKLPDKDYKPMDFGFPYMKLEDIQPTGTEDIMAKITLGIEKKTAKTMGRDEEKTWKNVKEYWDSDIENTITHEKISKAQKVMNLIEIKQDLRRMYSNEEIHPILLALDDLRDVFIESDEGNEDVSKLAFDDLSNVFIESDEDNGDVYYMPVRFVHLPEDLPVNKVIKQGKYVSVPGLLKTIFLNKATVEAIDQHDLEGKFGKDTPFEVTFVRKVDFYKEKED